MVEGNLNEHDAGIGLLQASMTDPNGGWFVLPAPPQFEYLAGDANVDYLILDTKNGRGVGAQVKSSGWTQAENGDNSGEIVHISGRHDLGNSMALPREHSRGYNEYSYAGSLALAAVHQLNPRSPNGKLMFQHDRWAMGYAKQQGKPRKLTNAAERLRYKVEAKL